MAPRAEKEAVFRVWYTLVPVLLVIWLWPWIPSLKTCLTVVKLQLLCAVFTYFRLAKYVRPDTEVSTAQQSTPQQPLSEPTLKRRFSVFDKVQFAKVNPLVNRTWKISERDRVQLAVASVTLLPLRTIGLIASLLFCYLIARVATFGMGDDDLKRPMVPWRRLLLYPLRFGARAILGVLGFHYVPVRGRKATHSEAPIIVCNHITFLEPIFLLSQYLPSPVAAYEHLKMPLIGTIVRALQTVTVDRRSPTSRKDVIASMKSRGANPLWPQTMIFPEGTCTNGSALITFKAGAFIPALPVQPIVVRYPHIRFDPSWVNAGPSQFSLLFRIMCNPVNNMEFQYLEPYAPSEDEQQNPKLYARNVRHKMALALGVEETEHSFEDVLLQQAAMAEELPPDTALVEYGKLKDAFSVNLDAIKKQFDLFRQMDTRGNGTVTLEEFIAFYGVKDSPQIERLFHMLDEEERGEINFREYLLGLGLLNELDEGSMHSLAFRMFDTEGSGHVQVSTLKSVFGRVFRELPDEEVDRIFSQFSTDTVGKEEFCKFAASDPRYGAAFKQHFFMQ